MRSNSLLIARALLASALLWPLVSRGAEANLPSATSSPERLVKAALEAELAGPGSERGELLKQALTLDPNHAPARWQAGYIRWDGSRIVCQPGTKRTSASRTLPYESRQRSCTLSFSPAGIRPRPKCRSGLRFPEWPEPPSTSPT